MSARLKLPVCQPDLKVCHWLIIQLKYSWNLPLKLKSSSCFQVKSTPMLSTWCWCWACEVLHWGNIALQFTAMPLGLCVCVVAHSVWPLNQSRLNLPHWLNNAWINALPLLSRMSVGWLENLPCCIQVLLLHQTTYSMPVDVDHRQRCSEWTNHSPRHHDS